MLPRPLPARALSPTAVLACVGLALVLAGGASTRSGASVPADAEPSAREVAECDSRGGAEKPYVRGVNCRRLEIDGFRRKFIVYLPERREAFTEAPPLVFMFHGSGGDGEKFLRLSGWRQKAQEEGLVAVFPTGLPYRKRGGERKRTRWNSFGTAGEVALDARPSGYPAAAPWPADDVKFVRRMVIRLRDGLEIDRDRVYAAGFSNGGSFAMRLAVQLSERLAAASAWAGGLPKVRPAEDPIPTRLTLGGKDHRELAAVNSADPPPDPPLTELPLDAEELLSLTAIRKMVRRHLDSFGLDREPTQELEDPDGGLVELGWTRALAPPFDAELTFTVLEGVRHRYPNADNNGLHGFEAAGRDWEFFRERRR